MASHPDPHPDLARDAPLHAGAAQQAATPALRQWILEQHRRGQGASALLQALRDAGWEPGLAAAVLALTLQEDPPPYALSAQPPAAALPGPRLDDSPARIDGGDRSVDVLLSMAEPRIVLLGKLLSPEECDALMAAAGSRMARSLTVDTRTGGEALNPQRTSDGMFFQRGETQLIERIEARIARLLHWPVENGEGLQVLHYRPGAEYRPHYDFFDPAEPGTPAILQRGGQRVGTLVMYLNTPDNGGGTTFPDVQLEVAAQRGNAVFFSYARPHPDTRSLHGGAPVITGEKWIATKWLREREFV